MADVYTKPPTLREYLQDKKNLGTFPLHRFWGPGTSIESSRWVAKASIAVDKKHNPTLTLMYLPHLDYSLQKYGPPMREGPGKGEEKGQARLMADLAEIDSVVEELVAYYESEKVTVPEFWFPAVFIVYIHPPKYL